MSRFSLKKNETVIVARLGGTEQVLKIVVASLKPDSVELTFEDSRGMTMFTGEEWDRQQADRLKQGADRPRQQAPYMN